jgi:hypothetical protein
MLEVEQATMHNEAQARLAEIRSQLGLAPAPEPASPLEQPAPGEGAAGAAPS